MCIDCLSFWYCPNRCRIGTYVIGFCMYSHLPSITRIKELFKNLLTIDQTYIKGSGYPPRHHGQCYDEYSKYLEVIGKIENIHRYVHISYVSMPRLGLERVWKFIPTLPVCVYVGRHACTFILTIDQWVHAYISKTNNQLCVQPEIQVARQKSG